MNLLMFELLLLVALVFLSAVFSATETAFTGLTFQQLRRTQKLKPGALSLWEREPHKVLATLLLSNNAVNAAGGVIAAGVAGAIAERHGWSTSVLGLVSGFIMSVAILIFGEIVPKILAQRFTVSWAVFITPFMRRWTSVVSPFARASAWIANALLMGFARRARPTPFLNKAGLRRLLTHARLPSLSHRLINNVIEFGRLTAVDVAHPRSEVFAISLQLPLGRVVENVIQSGYSRIPVFRQDVDDIVGLIYAKDLLVAWRSGTLVMLHDLLRPIIFVPPDMPLPELLRLFRVRRQHLALIRSSLTGRIEGVATLQNALAALVGEIKEED